MSDHDYRTKHLRRPVKAPAEKIRRQNAQRKRLVALGMPEAEVAKLQPDQLRTLVQRPAKVKKAVAKKAASASA